jgi:hypothetical protein
MIYITPTYPLQVAEQNVGNLHRLNQATGFALVLDPSLWSLLNDHAPLQCTSSVEEMGGYVLLLVGRLLHEVELLLLDYSCAQSDASD